MQAEVATSQLQRKLVLSLPAVEIETEISTRLKKIARTAKMSGFRPGKVPLSIVASQHGYRTRQEVMSEAVQRTFAMEAQRQNLRVAGYPRFEPTESGTSADKFEFSAVFEVYPEVSVGSVSGKKLVRPLVTVTELDVENTLLTLRKQRASFDPIERAAENGDLLVIDFHGTLSGASFEGSDAKDFKVTLGEGRLLPGFETALVGMMPGETKTFDLTFPSSYAAPLADQTAQFEVTLHSVSQPRLPELDAAFAKSLGVADGDLAKMRADITANLQRELKKRLRAKAHEQVMDALAAVTEVALPRALVEQEIDRLQKAAIANLEQRGMTTKDMQLPADLFVERAEKRVKLGLILTDIVGRNALRAKPEQIRAVVEEHAESFEDPSQMVRWYYSDASRLAEVEGMVLEDNVVEWAAASMEVSTPAQTFDEMMEIKR